MNRDTFNAQGRKLAGDAQVVAHLAAGFETLLASLSKQGLSLGATGAGELAPITPSGPGFGQFRGCLVDDPVFGTYVVRLELLVLWAGAKLELVAYACTPGTRSVSQVVRPCLAFTRGGTYPQAVEGEIHDARERLQAWIAGKLVDAAPEMGQFATLFRQNLDQALAP